MKLLSSFACIFFFHSVPLTVSGKYTFYFFNMQVKWVVIFSVQGCYVFLLDLSCCVEELGLAWLWECASGLGLWEALLRGVPDLSWDSPGPDELSFGVEGLFEALAVSWNLCEVEGNSDNAGDSREVFSNCRPVWETEATDGSVFSGERELFKRGSLLLGCMVSAWGLASLLRSVVSLVPGMLSFTGPSTLLATVASWETTLSTPLSPAVEVEEDAAAAAALAAACLRLSASFISLVMPPFGGGGVWGSRVMTGTVLGSSLLLTLAVLRSGGGAEGLANGSLLTVVNALPGVEKVLVRELGWGPGVLLLDTESWTFPRPSLEFSGSAEVEAADGVDIRVWVGFCSDVLASASDGYRVCFWFWACRPRLSCGEPGWATVHGVGDRVVKGGGPVLICGDPTTLVGLSTWLGGTKVVLRPSWLSSEPSSVSSSEESTSWMASCFCRDSLRSARSWRIADSLSFSLLLPGTSPKDPEAESGPSCRPSFRAKGFCRVPFSAGDTLPPRRVSLAHSCRLCKLGSRWSISFLKSVCEISRLCLRPAPTGSFLSAAEEGEGDDEEDESEVASFSADCTRFRRGERGGSALFGRAIWRTSGGEECSFIGKDWPMEELRSAWLASGEGERWGEVLWGVGEGVRASGDKGILPADLRRGERYWRCSFGARPWRELGRIWPELAGEFGTLELGELLWDEFPPTAITDIKH